MQRRIINILRILFIVIVLVFGTATILNKPNTQTNILDAIFEKNENSQMIIDLSSKFSSKINLIVEADLQELSQKTTTQIINEIDKNNFETQDINFKNLLKDYQKSYHFLLSKRTKELLINKDYSSVEVQAFERLINPIGFSLLPIEEDPYLLFSDYLVELAQNTTQEDTIKLNEKYYKITPITLNKTLSLSPTLANKEIKKLVDLQKKYTNGGTKVYLTGAPIHSYHASSKSILEINLICIFSTIFLLGIFQFGFKNLKLLIPTIVSLSLGCLMGYCVSGLIFGSLHILTFVFSTTLIGICIDYSLHYFVEKGYKTILKSMLTSLLTTCMAFMVLLFSGVELLKQIAVFTITGLTTVMSFVLLFYPLLKQNIFNDYQRTLSIEIGKKTKFLIYIILILVLAIGLFNIKFNDNIKNMYVPSKDMLQAEKLFNELTSNNQNQTLAIVKGDDIQTIIETEEKISKNAKDYQAISKYIPSYKTQNENNNLINELYKNSLATYGSNFLSKEQINTLVKKANEINLLNMDEDSFFKEFLLDDKTSVVVLYENEKEEKLENVKYLNIAKYISDKISEHRINCMKLIIPIFISLFILLVITYKNIKKAAKIIIPSILAVSFAICLSAVIAKEINMFHILSAFLIIGFGLDYSVFRASGVKKSTLAVFLSCATSVFSFLLLSFTGFKLISSIGLMLSIGLISSYILSLVFIPSSGLEENKENI